MTVNGDRIETQLTTHNSANQKPRPLIMGQTDLRCQSVSLAYYHVIMVILSCVFVISMHHMQIRQSLSVSLSVSLCCCISGGARTHQHALMWPA